MNIFKKDDTIQLVHISSIIAMISVIVCNVVTYHYIKYLIFKLLWLYTVMITSLKLPRSSLYMHKLITNVQKA